MNTYVDDGDITTSRDNMDIVSLDDNMNTDQTDDNVMIKTVEYFEHLHSTPIVYIRQKKIQ